MTDKAFKKKMDQTAIANYKYLALLSEIEREYERRYGHHPSDKDNDCWIDSFHQGASSMTVKEVEESVELCNSLS